MDIETAANPWSGSAINKIQTKNVFRAFIGRKFNTDDGF
jgi:hypothetical protein